MALGKRGVGKALRIERSEPRVPMEVGVRISGNSSTPGVETTFTENVSTRGARVRSIRRWRKGESLLVMSVAEGFKSLARVAYCENLPGNGFAIGVEFLELEGQWVMAAPGNPS